MSNDDSGPKFVWTFPLLTRFQTASLVDFGQGSTSVVEESISAVQSQPVRSKLVGGEGKQEEDTINELENELQDVQSESEDLFEQSDTYMQAEGGESATIEMSDDTFIPLRQSIDVGGSVTWTNNDDSMHEIVTDNTNEIEPTQVESGDTFSHTFSEEGVYEYSDLNLGQETMCGVILVGDVTFDEDLPCEQSPERELFEESNDSTRTLDEASNDMDGGTFNSDNDNMMLSEAAE